MATRCSRLQEELAALRVVSDSARLSSEKPISGRGDVRDQRSKTTSHKRDEVDSVPRAATGHSSNAESRNVGREPSTGSSVLHAMVSYSIQI